MHFDEVFDFLATHLAALGEGKDFRGQRAGPHSSDIWLPELAWTYWSSRVDRVKYPDAGYLEEEKFIPLYDAAWELCRIGVLRPGEFAPRGQSMAKAFGDGYVLTKFGREWVKQASQRPIVDPSRLSQVLQTFSKHHSVVPISSHRNGRNMCRIVVFGTSGRAKPADIGLKIRSTFLRLAVP